VIVDAKNGYIITNAHVVENATEITVQLLDNRSLKAKVVGSDPGSDVAVVKVQATNLVDLPIADSDKAEVGDYVVAIGNPFGLGHTVTSGIISALGRSGINPEGYEDFIQTDASINPGNSGGALVNLSGQLVGVNSAILSRSGGNIGIGFAIPSNMMKVVMNQLIKYGKVKRGVLGVNIQTLVPEIATSMGLPDSTQGALVSQVVDGSAADKAGVKAGDVVTAVNGRPVKDASSLRNAIGLLSVGEKVDLALLRDGKPRRVTAMIGEGDAAAEARATGQHPGLAGAEIIDSQNGVTIRSVAEGSPAAQRGLRANDVILAVGRTRVQTVADFEKATAGQDAFVLQIRRGSAMLVIPIR
jgi:serine protease Do/serine protease DegQ